MPSKPIPFTSLDKSADKPEVSIFNQNQIDGYWQEYMGPDGPKMIWTKRPGLTEFSDLSEPFPVDGLHYWTRQQKLMAVCNGKVFRIPDTGTETDVTGTATMVARQRPSFTDIAGTHLYIASSGQIGSFPAASTGSYLADGDAPTTVRFIAALNQILIAQRISSSRFDWSDSGAPTTWAGNFAQAETDPDLTRAFRTASAYLYFFSQKTTEIWRDDGTTFVRELQGAIARGTLAQDSIIDVNGVWYFLDDTREFVRLTGMTLQTISNPTLSRYLKSFDTFADCRGDYLKIQGRHFAVWSFPVEQKTIVYDIGLNQFYEWSYWNAHFAEHEAWLGSMVAESPEWNKVFAGDRRTGKIWEITGTTDAGATIRTVLRTDFIDRGAPDINKFTSRIVLVFKRADTATTPKTMEVRWRNDGDVDWSDERVVEIEKQGNTELRAEIRRCGHYRRRMLEFVMSDESQAALVSAQEEFTYGSR